MRRVFLFILLLSMQFVTSAVAADYTPNFSGDSAFDLLRLQCEIGPRPPGSDNIEQCRKLIQDTLHAEGWTVQLQNFTYKETPCVNIIATWPEKNNTTLVIGSHYDTRPHADQDPDSENRTRPIIGANDGGSSTAILLELAQSLPERARTGVELVFFDAEDSGYINGWDWIVGSKYYVSQLNMTEIERIDAMILVDMVGDKDLFLKREVGSTKSLQDDVWSVAAELGYDEVFLNQFGSTILDDHRPFIDAGIPALDIIQHNPFPWYWHTMEDTLDKCSVESLEIVGQVLETFIVNRVGADTEYPLDIPTSTLVMISSIAIVAITAIVVIARRRYKLQ